MRYEYKSNRKKRVGRRIHLDSTEDSTKEAQECHKFYPICTVDKKFLCTVQRQNNILEVQNILPR